MEYKFIFLFLIVCSITYILTFNDALKFENNDIWDRIINCVEKCVYWYFITFRVCWIYTLWIFNSLIYGYYHLLTILIKYLLTFPVLCIMYCVFGYYILFSFCWEITFKALTHMIDAYINYLGILTVNILAWPANLICAITVIICLYLVERILKVILDFKKISLA